MDGRPYFWIDPAVGCLLCTADALLRGADSAALRSALGPGHGRPLTGTFFLS